MSKHFHPWHLVDPSPWPYVGSTAALGLTSGAVMYYHNFIGGGLLMTASLSLLIVVMIVWWRDVIREASYQGHHTTVVQRGLKLGMILFILSEVIFFISFFWGFFHSALSPDVSIGSVWPPVGIEVLDPFEVPLLNTAILLSSGVCHKW